MSDLISRQDAIDYFVTNIGIVDADGYSVDDYDERMNIWTERFSGIPSAEPEIIRCADCKWWDRLEEDHPYGYCLACRSGTHTERWEISIYRQTKFDFFCGDAELKGEEE